MMVVPFEPDGPARRGWRLDDDPAHSTADEATEDVSTLGLPAEVVGLNETDATLTIRATGPDGTDEELVLSVLAAQRLINRCEDEITQRTRLVNQLRAGLRALAGPAVPGLMPGFAWARPAGPPHRTAADGTLPATPGQGDNTGPNHTLRRLRQQRNLSQAELAEEIRDTAQRMGLHLACDEKRIGRWERGEVRWPSPVYRRVLRAVFGVRDVAELGFRPPSGLTEQAAVPDG
ncbi:hypothetical protein LI90_793 [Carbonactinospora thermoautotrophica]|uniref:HTH cro/C1-type domain-containing protein n=2 Tax=Carbonactinospora thermoautotrophica TaxID=1469144 RepID=A0A132MN64_9ACTN|nr:hypothetical protein LI90_793 [Carbonactinospora thermoautotrophica]